MILRSVSLDVSLITEAYFAEDPFHTVSRCRRRHPRMGGTDSVEPFRRSRELSVDRRMPLPAQLPRHSGSWSASGNCLHGASAFVGEQASIRWKVIRQHRTNLLAPANSAQAAAVQIRDPGTTPTMPTDGYRCDASLLGPHAP